MTNQAPPFTRGEESTLRRLVNENLDDETIAKVLQRTVFDVGRKRRSMGLKRIPGADKGVKKAPPIKTTSTKKVEYIPDYVWDVARIVENDNA